MLFARAMDGVTVTVLINRRPMNTPAARAKNGDRWDLPQSLVILKSSLLLIV
jgi:hypothetical protein